MAQAKAAERPDESHAGEQLHQPHPRLPQAANGHSDQRCEQGHEEGHEAGDFTKEGDFTNKRDSEPYHHGAEQSP
jgi:hypothetical protein